MKYPVKAPSVGESITEVSILRWIREEGEAVRSGDLLLEIESDKATVEIVSEHTGALKILVPAGTRIPVGALIAEVDDSVVGKVIERKVSEKKVTSAAATTGSFGETNTSLLLGPAARKVAMEKGIDPRNISGTGKGGRITKEDLQTFMTRNAASVLNQNMADRPGDRRVPMSMLRQKIAERLVYAQHTAAILTTFNEADLSAVMAFRKQHKEFFLKKHGVNLGFMSFFVRACVEAIKEVPEVNASLDGTDIVYHDYCDVGVAVGTDRGLVVPVLRNAHQMDFPTIEKRIFEMAQKARDAKLSLPELSGGTFTISNGGVYGSMLSTPILNPPQSGILGMHKIMERPVAMQGKIEIRPMMYLALSYDHRLIDGKGAVTFLVKVKEALELPEKLNFSY